MSFVTGTHDESKNRALGFGLSLFCTDVEGAGSGTAFGSGRVGAGLWGGGALG